MPYGKGYGKKKSGSGYGGSSKSKGGYKKGSSKSPGGSYYRPMDSY